MTQQSGGGGVPSGAAGGVLGGTYPSPTYASGAISPTIGAAFAQLGADVPLTPINTYTDILTLSLVAGTWLLFASVTINQQTNSGGVQIAFWDGSANFGSGELVVLNTTNRATLTAMARVTPVSTTTYHLRGAATALTCTAIAAVISNNVGNNATSFIAIRTA